MSETIPKKWKLKNLSSIAILKGRIGWRGYTTADLRDGGPLALGAGNISKENKLDLTEKVHLSQEKYDESPDIMVKEKDILIVQRGSLGKIALIEKDIGNATINPSMILVKEIKTNPEFLYYYLCGDKIQKEIKDCLSQTGVPMISQEQCKNFEIILPSYEEQEKIALILENVDNNIEKTQEIIEKYEMMKQGLMYDLFTKGINENGKPHTEFKDSELGKIPINWNINIISDITEVISGGTPKTNIKDYWNGSIVWITPDDLSGLNNNRTISTSSRKITKEGLNNSSAKLINKGSLVMSSRAPIGYLAIVDNDFATNQGCKSFQSDKIDIDYLYYYLSFIIERIKEKGEGTTFSEISKNQLEKILILVPHRKEQVKIASQLKSIDNKIQSEQKYLHKFQKIKTGLMQDLLTGKVRVKT